MNQLIIRTRSIHALRAALAIPGMNYYQPHLYLQRQPDGITDLYATDGYSAVTIENPDITTDWAYDTIAINHEKLKIPANATEIQLVLNGTPDDAEGHAQTPDGAKLGFLRITKTKAPQLRKAIPRNPQRLPASNPGTFDPIRAAKVLTAAKEKGVPVSRPVRLHERNIGHQWVFLTGGTYTLVALREEQPTQDRFWNLIEKEHHQ